MIRRARMSDIPELVEIGFNLVNDSPRFKRLTYSPTKVARLLTFCIESPTAVAFVAEDNGEVIGAGLAVLDSEWFSDDLITQELVLCIKKNKRGHVHASALVTAMRDWGRETTAVYMQAGSSTGNNPEMTIGLYEKEGFARCGIGCEFVYLRGA